jgi:hypothetical protein
MARQSLEIVLVSGRLKRIYVRGALDPKRMPESKMISPERQAELNRRAAAYDAKPHKPK